MFSESEEYPQTPAHGELAESIPDALGQFNALTSPEGVEAETQRLHDEMNLFLDENNQWDEKKANNFENFLAHKAFQLEEKEDKEAVSMLRQTRKQFYRIESDYRRYLDMTYEKPIIAITIDDPRGQAIIRAGESKSRHSDRQIFIPINTPTLQRSLDNNTPRLFMQDINTQKPGTGSIAVNRLVAVGASFKSWTSGYAGVGNKREEGTQNVKKSADLISDYAERSTEIPPLEEVTALITTDGAIYYMATGGAHRAAAAIMKGQERLDATTIVFRKIDMSSGDIEAYAFVA